MKPQAFAVVGDPHLNCSRVSTRLDDYSLTAISKLDQIRTMCIEKGIGIVVLLGDVFHKNVQSNLYINQVLYEMSKFQKDNITVYSIIGNHDIIQDRLDSIEKSPLNMFFITGLIKKLEEVDLGWCKLRGFDYSIPISPNEGNSKVPAFCFAHMFYEGVEEKDNISREDAETLGYDAYFLGHDHVTYDDVILESGKRIVRPGSLLRGTSHSYNLSKIPCFNIVKHEEGQILFDRDFLKVVPAEDVFSHEALNKREKTRLEYSSIDRMDELIEQMTSKYGNDSIYSILDEMKMSDTARDIIVTYLENQGIFR